MIAEVPTITIDNDDGEWTISKNDVGWTIQAEGQHFLAFQSQIVSYSSEANARLRVKNS